MQRLAYLTAQFPADRVVPDTLWTRANQESHARYEGSVVKNTTMKSLQRNVLLEVLEQVIGKPSKDSPYALSFLDGERLGMTHRVMQRYRQQLQHVTIDVPNPEARNMKPKMENCRVWPAHDSEFYGACAQLKQQDPTFGYNMIWFDRCGTPDESLYAATEGAIQCGFIDDYMVLGYTFCARDQSKTKTCMYVDNVVTHLSKKYHMLALNLTDLVGLACGGKYHYYFSIYVVRPMYEHHAWKDKCADVDVYAVQKHDACLEQRIKTMFHRRYFHKFRHISHKEVAAPWNLVQRPESLRSSKRLRGESVDDDSAPFLPSPHMPKLLERKVSNVDHTVMYKCKWGIHDIAWINVHDLAARYGAKMVKRISNWDIRHVDLYQVERLVDVNPANDTYLVRWAGYPADFDTWETKSNFENFELLYKEMMQSPDKGRKRVKVTAADDETSSLDTSFDASSSSPIDLTRGARPFRDTYPATIITIE